MTPTVTLTIRPLSAAKGEVHLACYSTQASIVCGDVVVWAPDASHAIAVLRELANQIAANSGALTLVGGRNGA